MLKFPSVSVNHKNSTDVQLRFCPYNRTNRLNIYAYVLSLYVRLRAIKVQKKNTPIRLRTRPTLQRGLNSNKSLSVLITVTNRLRSIKIL